MELRESISASRRVWRAAHTALPTDRGLRLSASFCMDGPRVLRYDKRSDTLGQPAINIGEAKGSTFDDVLIFTTGPMRQYLRDRDPSALRSRAHLYVAVTRARHSVAFVV